MLSSKRLQLSFLKSILIKNQSGQPINHIRRSLATDISCGGGFCNAIISDETHLNMNSSRRRELSEFCKSNSAKSKNVGQKRMKSDPKIPVVYGQVWTPRPVKDPPEDYDPKEFVNENFEPPVSVEFKAFRHLDADEVLGPDAGKCKEYKNPEYFAFHRYSFIELYVNTLDIRNNGPKPVIDDGSDEGNDEEKDQSEKGLSCSNGQDSNSIRSSLSDCCIPPLNHWETGSLK